MKNNKITITVLGAGISGLATAYWLNKENFNVKVIEKKSRPGGAMETSNDNNFLIDFGPNSGLETTPVISKLVNEVGLKNEMIYANEEGDTRYILKNHRLHALPTSPVAFTKTKLFSTAAKFRVMGEPFIGKSSDGYYQSIAEFVERRLGKEFLDYAIDPFVSGVFAGDPYKLSVKSAFPKLYRLEELYGGLVKGMIKGARERKKRAEVAKQDAKMFSFINGMQSFPQAIANTMSDNIEYNCVVNEIAKTKDGYIVKYQHGKEKINLNTDIVLSTIPAEATSKIFNNIDNKLSNHLDLIFYPPVMVLYLGFNKNDIGQTLDGFGYLIPSKENKKYLGAIWSSTIFTNRADDNSAAFTLFVGGAKADKNFAAAEDKLISDVIDEFKSTMNISEKPVIVKHKLWNKAIPQYNLGYIEHEKYFEEFELMNPGLFLSGNYRGGISVGDCVKNSEIVSNRIISFVKNNYDK